MNAARVSQGNRIIQVGDPMDASIGNADKVIFNGTDNELVLDYLNAFFHDTNSRDVLIIEGNGNRYRLFHQNVIDNSVGSCDTIILKGDANHIDLLSGYFMDNTYGHDSLQTIAADSSYQVFAVSETAALTLYDSTENKLTHQWLPIQQVVAQYEKSAVRGDTMATFYLGEIYQLGVGAPVDIEKALYYYSIAAKAGQRGSRSALGYLYEGHYDGIPHNIELAKHWYGLAAKQGDPYAIQRLKVIDP